MYHLSVFCPSILLLTRLELDLLQMNNVSSDLTNYQRFGKVGIRILIIGLIYSRKALPAKEALNDDKYLLSENFNSRYW